MLHNFQCLIPPTYENGEFMNFQTLTQFGLFAAILATAFTYLAADHANQLMRERILFVLHADQLSTRWFPDLHVLRKNALLVQELGVDVHVLQLLGLTSLYGVNEYF